MLFIGSSAFRLRLLHRVREPVAARFTSMLAKPIIWLWRSLRLYGDYLDFAAVPLAVVRVVSRV